MPRKKKGNKLTRSEIVTVRLDPKLKYGMELAARRQRRTVSGYIEWAVERSLSEVAETARAGQRVSIRDILDVVWSPLPHFRFLHLAEMFPQLMSIEEEIIWNTIQRSDVFWFEDDLGPDGGKMRQLEPDMVDEFWDQLQEVADGERDIGDIDTV